LPRSRSTPAFGEAARRILDRWTAERDTRLTGAEIEQVRDYLRRVGVRTVPLEDGGFRLAGTERVLDPTQLALLGLRRLAARRVRE